MGNGIGTLAICFSGNTPRRHSGRRHISRMVPEQFDEGLGHSFCYVRPDPSKFSSSKVHSEEATIPAMTTTTFRSISGASVSANTSTPLSTSLSEFCNSFERASAAFESSTSFSSVPLQPVPVSGPIERGFLSGPIERAFLSGPLLFSGPIASENDQFQRSFSHGAYRLKPRSRKGSVIRVLRKVISKTIARSAVAPVKGPVLVKDLDWVCEKNAADNNLTISSANLSSELSLEDDDSLASQNLEWAQGKAGEDRVHVVISEEHGWVFVGIYDGFNGPDAPDFLLSNLYSYVHKELKGLLWEDKLESVKDSEPERISTETHQSDCSVSKNSIDDSRSQSVETENYPFESMKHLNPNPDSKRTRIRKSKNKYKSAAKKWEENQRRWKLEWERERLELERKLKEQLSRSSSHQSVNRSDVLKALSQALRKTEEAYFDIADNMLSENPELALMGSCVLVMLMKGEDVYLMNVGDSRAVLAQKAEPDVWGSLGKDHQDLERIKEETLHDLEVSDGDQTERLPSLSALQLSVDHSTSVEEEVQRIKNEHPDDAFALANDRVKGSLKVTRAFGAGFLKQPKWNSALLEAFQIDYVGASPYINCIPSLHHHRLGSKDKFLILSSDGLYQYFTNEEAVAEVELFIDSSPDGDPAQHLVEVVLFRAAEKAGMDFHELLEIPQGDRRRYHDDVSIIVISLEGRIWRSCM